MSGKSIEVRNELVRIGNNGTSEQLSEFYTNNAYGYNEMLALIGYTDIAPLALAQVVAKVQPNKEARILDCAAGSGYAGQSLHKLGYNNIDALDPSLGLLEIAKTLKVYQNFIVDSVSPDKRNSVEDGTYDAIFICGSVIEGHITLDYMPQVTRMLKKGKEITVSKGDLGGTLTFNISDKFLKSTPSFEDEAVKTLFQGYVDDGIWVKWEVIRAPYCKTEECNIYTIFV